MSTTENMTERDWRKAIAEQVRRNCTVPSEVATPGSDAVVYAVADWIENPPEWSKLPEPEAADPAVLTPADFEMQWDADHHFPFVESEDAAIMAYGHPDPTELAAQITEYDILCAGERYRDEVEATSPDAIRQTYAIVTEGKPRDEWQIRWGQPQDAPGAFPVSVVVR